MRQLCGFLRGELLNSAHVCLLGGSGVVRSGVISPLIRVISIVTLVITLLRTTHEPPSTR